MGTNYYQYGIVGVKVKLKDILAVESPAVYEKQSRYDTRTGLPISTENVLVKDEVSYYMFMGTRYDEIYDIEYDERYKDLEFQYSEYDEAFYLGVDVGEERDCGRATLLGGEASVDDITNKVKCVQEFFPDLEVKLYFCVSVG
jgi:hypothetical protein